MYAQGCYCTDTGWQYCSHAYRDLLGVHELKQSMMGKGNCYDNAMCESLFYISAAELLYRFRYEKRDQAKRSIFWYT